MTSHIHLIVGTEKGKLSDIIRDLKSFTSREIRKCIEQNERESRREWLLWMMKRAGSKNKRNNDFQFWQQHNHPIELSDSKILNQRLDYIHSNPVVQGFVEKEEEWSDSSCSEYYGAGKSKIELCII